MDEVQSNASAKLKLARKQARDDELAFLSKLAANSTLEPAEPAAQVASGGGMKRAREGAAAHKEEVGDEEAVDASALTLETDVDASSAKRRRASQGALPSAAHLLRVRAPASAPAPALAQPVAAAPRIGLVAYDSSDDSSAGEEEG